jgi:hypothetical protein
MLSRAGARVEQSSSYTSSHLHKLAIHMTANNSVYFFVDYKLAIHSLATILANTSTTESMKIATTTKKLSWQYGF